MNKVNMSDNVDVLHAAIKSMEADGFEAMKPKIKAKPKETSQIWENLYGYEEKDLKFDKEEKEFIPEEKPKQKKKKHVIEESKVSTKFDDDSL